MVSPNQSNQGSKDYPTKEAETVDRWTDEMLMNVIPEREESARRYVGACNMNDDVRQEVTEHFVNCVKRLKD